MAGREFSMEKYLRSRCAGMAPLYEFDGQTEAEARGWRIRAVAKLRDLLGEMPDSVQLEAETIESVDMGGWVRERVIFDADKYSSVPAYLMIPKGLTEPAPAVLCLHGHGPGKDVVAGVTDADGACDAATKARYIEEHCYDYARQFVEQGYVTLTFDYRCFGERASTPFPVVGRDLCNVQFLRASLMAVNMQSLHVHDTIRAIDYLSGRSEVNEERMGCVGLSFGGTMTLWISALDKRIKAAVSSCAMSELDTYAVGMGNFCGSQYVPALRRYFDICDIAALVAPRPLMIQSGTLDEGFPIDSARSAMQRVKAAYHAWEKPKNLAHDVFEGGHRFNPAPAHKWIAKHL